MKCQGHKVRIQTSKGEEGRKFLLAKSGFCVIRR
jgi:hypothetical protein